MRGLAGEGRRTVPDADDFLPTAVSKACTDDPGLFEDNNFHKALQKIVEQSEAVNDEVAKAFEGRLLKTVGKSNRGCFVLASMCKAKGKTGKFNVKELTKDKKEITKRAKKEKGCQLLLTLI